jgi:hypothetical protein
MSQGPEEDRSVEISSAFVRASLVVIVALLLSISGCAQDARVTHIVVCWLKNPGDADARRQLIADSKSFTKIPGVVAVSAGSVLPSTRPSVDSSFDVAVVMKFKDEKALASYASHPIHLQAVERTLRPLVAKYVIYDYVESDASPDVGRK